MKAADRGQALMHASAGEVDAETSHGVGLLELPHVVIEAGRRVRQEEHRASRFVSAVI